MPNITQVLKEEIARVSRKELKQDLLRLKQDTVWLKKSLADFKRRIVALERQNRLLKAKSSRLEKVSTPEPKKLRKMRATGKMIRSLRDKLGLTQAELAKMLEVSGQSVYQWERKEGRLRLRENAKSALQRVRQMGKREVRAELEKLG